MDSKVGTQDRGHQATSPAQMPRRAWKDIALRTWQRTWEDNVGLVAAGVAFYGFFAIVPLLGLIVLIYGVFADPATVISNMQALTDILPNDVAELIGEQLMGAVEASAGMKGLGIAVALAVALYAGTNGAGAVITALNIAYEEKERRSLFRFYLVAIAITFAAVTMALLGLGAAAAIAALDNFIPDASGPIVMAGKIVGYFALGLAAAAIAATLYRFGPSRENARWEWITPGSIVAAAAWMLLTLAFGFYVTSIADYNATYGSLGTIIVLLTWIYLSAYMLVMGAELNSEIEHQTAHDSTTGPAQPMGKRGAWAADNVAEDDTVQNRPEEAREGDKLTQASPDMSDDRKD
ncbi:MAG TPA: YihY/virulence factor BrkB family protein [Sphingomicrobium sp.]|nr:YihY/virulence factor BrkB family protein [Sphingomicrobium sp.]